MRITTETLIAAGMLPTQARVFAEPLAAACAKFGIDTAKRAGGLIGQCMVESMNFGFRKPAILSTPSAQRFLRS
jgi:predicted chitinase